MIVNYSIFKRDFELPYYRETETPLWQGKRHDPTLTYYVPHVDAEIRGMLDTHFYLMELNLN